MMEYNDNEFIKLNRKILNWEWYSDNNTRSVFIHCLLRANWKAGKWKGVSYERGQFITSLASLSKEIGISVRQVRVALDHLYMTGELTSKNLPKARIITVVKYDEYQSRDKQNGKQVTAKRQASDKQVTTDIRTKEYKEYKEVKNNTAPPEQENWHGLTPEEIEELKKEGYE